MSNLGYTAMINTDPITGLGAVSVTIDGKTVNIPSDAANYEDLIAALRTKASKEAVAKLMTPIEHFKALAQDAGFEIRLNVSLDKIGVFWEGAEVHSKVADMIIEHHHAGEDFTTLKNFLKKAMNNVNGVGEMDTLFDFIKDAKLPLHPDGDFLAFKATRGDGFDKHTGTVKYEVGQYLEVKNFDKNKFTQCGQGLHVGDRKYVKSYGTIGNDAFFVVKVNPANAIFYRDHSYSGKMRVCKLFVYAQIAMGEGVDLEQFLPFMVASSPEGDILELAALNDPIEQAPSDIPEAPVEDLEGRSAKVAKKTAKPASKPVKKAKKGQSFVSVGKGKMTFLTKDNVAFTAKQVLDNVAQFGQRGWSAKSGIPRTTIQDWLKAINGATRKR